MAGQPRTASPPAIRLYDEPLLEEPRTYVVIGTPRGGTSLIGGLVRLCGLPFGEGLLDNHEDPAFNFEAIQRSGQDPATTLRQTVRQRNAAHPVWGWKYPRASRYLDAIRSDLRNPHLLVVLRDPVAAAGRHRGADGGRRSAIHLQHERQVVNVELMERWQVPTLAISYERGVDQPVRLTRQIARFLGTPAPDKVRVREFVRPGTYQKIK
ncbi:sulfotransferase family protein [Nocardioides sambongensis]|uniref:hypothetical protein n=1 Tax=Nocardioides sambongensis TaxID=2589074 RepID=UPI00112D84B4|nr:hypothetical protein [Nocardioides sambongensis]